MPQINTKKIIPVLILTFLFLGMFYAPVSANFFPFLSKKTLLPDEYSKYQEQIDTYNEQAIDLFEKGYFKEAQELWEKAIAIIERTDRSARKSKRLEVTSDASDEDISVAPKESNTRLSEDEKLYQKAVFLFKEQKYVASKNIFDQIEARTPDYKATRNYLTILKHKIKKVQQTLSDDRFQEGALHREKERSEWRRILKESEAELEKKLNEQVAPLYNEALQLFKERKFALAKDYFKEVDSILPNYKDTAEYLLRIDTDIKQEEQRLVKENYKKQVLARKKEQEEWQRIMQESERQLQERLQEQAEPIYQEALHYYKLRQFELAKNRFEDVDQIVPEYKSTAKYLSRIDDDMVEEARNRELERVREYERNKKEQELAKKREEERQQRLKAIEEKNRLQQFQKEVAARRNEREEWLKILKESEAQRQRKIKEQADFVYREAVQYYKKRDFERAKEDFLEVQRILPDYKSTANYLIRIDEDIEEEEKLRLAQQQRLQERQLEENRIVERRQLEEEQRAREIANEKRTREFNQKALARKKQREQWDKVLKEKEQERQKKLNQEADFIYKEALRAYKKKDWEHARNSFIEVAQILPDYKKTEEYLDRIDDDIEKERIQFKLAEERSTARARKEEARLRKLEEDRQKELAEADKKKQMKRQKKQAETVYKFAESLYKRGDHVRAREKFLEVESILPEYRSAARYLKRIDEDIELAEDRNRQELELVSQRSGREQQLALKYKEDKIDKMMKIEERTRQKELKKEALARQKEREEWERTIKRIEAENQKQLRKQVDAIYRDALRYYKAGWYEQAKETFEEVDATLPGYKSTEKYLVKTDRKIMRERQLQQDSERKIRDFSTLEDEPQKSHTKTAYTFPEKNGNAFIQKAVKEREKKRSKEAEIKYREALDSYKAKNFIEAKLKFIEIESFSPGYKATLDYLKRIDEKILEQKPQIAQPKVEKPEPDLAIPKKTDDRQDIIRQALLKEETHFQKKDLPAVIPAEKPVKEFKVRTKTVKSEEANWDQQIKDRRAELKVQRRAIHKEYDKQFKQLYDKAVKLYRSGSYIEAEKLFRQIERMKPGYKKAASYIKKSKKKIKKGLQRETNTSVVRSKNAKSRSDVIGEALDVLEQGVH